MNSSRAFSRRSTVVALAAALLCAASATAAAAHEGPAASPVAVAAAAEVVTLTKADDWEKGGVTVMTRAVAVKETGPKETVARFGEVYSFAPSFIAARRERPLLVRFWNLQPDDEHDFALFDAKGRALANFKLPPLSSISYFFTFHQDGLFDFRCTIHQPGMSGQILVLPK